MDIVSIVCDYCSESPTTVEVLECEHAVCSRCIQNLPRNYLGQQSCPECRQIIRDDRRATAKTSSFRLAWNLDIESGFGAGRDNVDDPQAGRRIGDETEAQQLERMSRELAQRVNDGELMETML